MTGSYSYQRRSVLGLLASLPLLAGAPPGLAASGRTFHVDPAGNDSGDGSAVRPWRSIGRVNDARLRPGDTVEFRTGGRWRDATLVARPGVTYRGAPGVLPVLSPREGHGIVIDRGVRGVRIERLEVAGTRQGAVWIDRASDIVIAGCHFHDTVRDGSGKRTLQAFHTPDLHVEDSVFERCGGADHAYLYGCDRARLTGNRMRWDGPQDGDCIHVSASNDIVIAGNDLEYVAGGKGCIIVMPWEGDQSGALILGNRTRGGQFGIAPRMNDCKVVGNRVIGAGRQADARRWASGIWMATGSGERHVRGVEIRDCVIEQCRHGIFGWDDPDWPTTRYAVRHCLVRDCDRAWFGHGRGDIEVEVARNLVIAAGAEELPDRRARVHFVGNHFHLTDGEPGEGAPRLDGTLRVVVGSPGHGTGIRRPALPRHGPLPAAFAD